MHDLELMHPDGRIGAVEVTSATDETSTALWKLMNDSQERWLVDGLRGGWSVAVEPLARAKRLRAELPGLLSDLESLEIQDFDPQLPRRDRLAALARELRVVNAFQGGTNYPGSIYITLELEARSGSLVSPIPNALAEWIGHFLHDPERAGDLDKLERSCATEKHAFVIVRGFTTAPDPVAYILMPDGVPPPGG
jgi:hypothetical protein